VEEGTKILKSRTQINVNGTVLEFIRIGGKRGNQVNILF